MSPAASPTLLVTGASGHLGQRVVDLLVETGAGDIIATTRSPGKLEVRDGVQVRAADFDDPASMDRAFAGATRMLLISTDALDRPGHRMEQHVRAIDAAKRAGVQHIVYTSLSHAIADSPVLIAGDHVGTEAALYESGLGFTILRNNLYTDLLLMSLPQAIATGQLFAAAGDQGAAYITREDCARAAASALASSFGGQRTLEVTGPEVLTYADLAVLASEVSGKPVHHIALEPAALVDGMVQSGAMPEAVAKLWVSFDEGMARGLFGPATESVQELSGRAPESVASFITRHRNVLTTPRDQQES